MHYQYVQYCCADSSTERDYKCTKHSFKRDTIHK